MNVREDIAVRDRRNGEEILERALSNMRGRKRKKCTSVLRVRVSMGQSRLCCSRFLIPSPGPDLEKPANAKMKPWYLLLYQHQPYKVLDG